MYVQFDICFLNCFSCLELSASTVKVDSEPNSEKSDNFEELLDADTDVSSNGSNENKNEDDFDSNLPSTVTLLKHDNIKVYLVGTAHFSEESKKDVEQV